MSDIVANDASDFNTIKQILLARQRNLLALDGIEVEDSNQLAESELTEYQTKVLEFFKESPSAFGCNRNDVIKLISTMIDVDPNKFTGYNGRSSNGNKTNGKLLKFLKNKLGAFYTVVDRKHLDKEENNGTVCCVIKSPLKGAWSNTGEYIVCKADLSTSNIFCDTWSSNSGLSFEAFNNAFRLSTIEEVENFLNIVELLIGAFPKKKKTFNTLFDGFEKLVKDN